MTRSQPGLILAAAPYPTGGLHGDHLIVIWNHGGHGYFAQSFERVGASR